MGGSGEGRGSGWGMRSRLGLATGAIWLGLATGAIWLGTWAIAGAATLRRILVTIVDSRREEFLDI